MQITVMIIKVNNCYNDCNACSRSCNHLAYCNNLSYRRGTARHSMLVSSAMFHQLWQLVSFQRAKVTFKVILGHWHRCYSIVQIRFPISLPLQLCLYLATLRLTYFPKFTEVTLLCEHIPFGDNILCMH